MATRIQYGIRNRATLALVTHSARSNGGADFAGETETYLTDVGDNDRTWLVSSQEHAEYVLNFSTPWYNASYETPSHEFDPAEYEVVRIETAEPVISAITTSTLPTIDQYFDYRATVNPNERDLIEHFREQAHVNGFHPNWYDLQSYFEWRQQQG